MTTAASDLYLQTSNDFSFHSRTDNNIINIQGDGERALLLGIFGAIAEDNFHDGWVESLAGSG